MGERCNNSSSFKDSLVISENIAEDLRAGAQRYLEAKKRLFLSGTSFNHIYTLIPGISEAKLFDNLIAKQYAPEHTLIGIPKYGPAIAGSCSSMDLVHFYSKEAREEYLETYERYQKKAEFIRNVEAVRQLVDSNLQSLPLGFIVVIDYEARGHTGLMSFATIFRALELSQRPPLFDFAEFLEQYHNSFFYLEGKELVTVADLGNDVRLSKVVLGEKYSWIENTIDNSFYDLLWWKEKNCVATVKPLLYSLLKGVYKDEYGSTIEIKTEADIFAVGWEICKPRPGFREMENPAAIIRSYCQSQNIDFLSLLELSEELARKTREVGSALFDKDKIDKGRKLQYYSIS